MNLEPFDSRPFYGEKYASEIIWTKNNVEITVDPNDSSVTIVNNDDAIITLSYNEYCNLLDKLMHLKKRLKKHHYAGNGVIGTKNKIKAQIGKLQKQLAELE